MILYRVVVYKPFCFLFDLFLESLKMIDVFFLIGFTKAFHCQEWLWIKKCASLSIFLIENSFVGNTVHTVYVMS